MKPNIAEFNGGETVRFADGSSEEIDLVIYCTGYKISFPFFEPDLISAPDNEIPLYRHVVSPEHAGHLLHRPVQPLGAIMPIAEAQSEWVADLLEGRTTLPGAAEMRTLDRRATGSGWRAATCAPSATRSRSTSPPTCARSRASAGAATAPSAVR